MNSYKYLCLLILVCSCVTNLSHAEPEFSFSKFGQCTELSFYYRLHQLKSKEEVSINCPGTTIDKSRSEWKRIQLSREISSDILSTDPQSACSIYVAQYRIKPGGIPESCATVAIRVGSQEELLANNKDVDQLVYDAQFALDGIGRDTLKKIKERFVQINLMAIFSEHPRALYFLPGQWDNALNLPTERSLQIGIDPSATDYLKDIGTRIATKILIKDSLKRNVIQSTDFRYPYYGNKTYLRIWNVSSFHSTSDKAPLGKKDIPWAGLDVPGVPGVYNYSTSLKSDESAQFEFETRWTHSSGTIQSGAKQLDFTNLLDYRWSSISLVLGGLAMVAAIPLTHAHGKCNAEIGYSCAGRHDFVSSIVPLWSLGGAAFVTGLSLLIYKPIHFDRKK